MSKILKFNFILSIVFLGMVHKGLASVPIRYSSDITISADDTYTVISIDADVIVTIPDGFTITCLTSLDFEGNNGSLIVESGGNLTFTTSADVLNNANATFTIEHGGSFLPTTTTTFAAANVQIQKTASSTGYSYITPLVSSSTFPFHVYEYNESNIDAGNSNFGTWEVILSGNALVEGIGYAANQEGAISYTGLPILGIETRSLSVTSSGSRGTNSGHHLIGNPYTAAIDMDAFFSTSANTTNTYASYYIWDATDNGGLGDYTSYSAIGGFHVSSGQAFFIQLDYGLGDGSYNIEFNPNVRVTGNNTAFFRSSAAEFGEIELNIKTENDLKNKLIFRFDDSFTEDYDKGYEAYPFQITNTGDLKVYSTSNEKNFDILALPLNGDLVIPITLNTKEAYNVTSEVMNYSSLPEGYKFELVNLETDEVLELAQNAKISSNMSKSDDEVKFELRVTAPAQILDIDDKESIFIYTTNNQLVFKNLEQVNNASQAVMYSLDGRVINNWTIPAGINEYSLPLSGNLNGLYIVKVRTISGQYLKKIVLNK
jgi:hypothetical protein